jgi:hypothetical protein
MTCLFNTRAYRDGSAAAPRRSDTSYWVLGCRGLVREHLVPRVQGAGLPRRGTTCQGVPTAIIAPLKDIENLQYTFLFPGAGSCPGPARVLPGSSAAPLGSNWRLRLAYPWTSEGYAHRSRWHIRGYTHTLSIAKAACLWMCPVPWEISTLSMPAMTAAAASRVSSWRAALNAAGPIGTPSMSMPCVCFGVLPRRAHLRILGEERARACAVGVPLALALLELECAAIKVEAPFKLRLDCCDGVRRGYGGSIIHDGRHSLGPRAPFLPQ